MARDFVYRPVGRRVGVVDSDSWLLASGSSRSFELGRLLWPFDRSGVGSVPS
jgi:hypothetical protein